MLTEEFKTAVRSAIDAANQAPDDAIRFMARTIPIYLDDKASPEQGAAAGCPKCSYLGLWADHWPGYPSEPHGMIWLFENSIRTMGPDLVNHAYDVLVHEMSHALQRDHVLDAMEAEARGMVAPTRGCNCPGSSTFR